MVTIQLTDAERDTVVKVLQHVRLNGFVRKSIVPINKPLSWFKRCLNWLVYKLGADRLPFMAEGHYTLIEARHHLFGLNHDTFDDALYKIAPEQPKCRRCGSTDLTWDTDGEYYDACHWNGAPLVCLTCRNLQNV